MDGSYSGSSSSTSGVGPVRFGNKTAGGGLKIPSWAPLAIVAGIVTVAVVALVVFAKK